MGVEISNKYLPEEHDQKINWSLSENEPLKVLGRNQVKHLERYLPPGACDYKGFIACFNRQLKAAAPSIWARKKTHVCATCLAIAKKLAIPPYGPKRRKKGKKT